MKKQFLSWGLILSLLLTLLPVPAMAAEQQEPETPPAQNAYTLSPDTEVHSVNTLTGTGTETHDHSDGSWTALSGTISSYSFSSGGNYYLSDSEVTASSDITISGDVTLCLNGQTLALGEFRTLTVSSGATLTICDCAGDGQITGAQTSAGSLIDVSGSLKLYGGRLEQNGSNREISTVCVNDDGNFLVDGINASIHLGNGNKDTVSSAAIYVADGGSLTFQNGTITTGDNQLEGINVGNNMSETVNASTNVIIAGGAIPSLGIWATGRAEILGGIIGMIGNFGQLTMTGGAITPQGEYGGISNMGGTATLSGSASVTADGTAISNNCSITGSDRKIGALNISEQVSIRATGTDSIGIANNGGTVTLSDTPTIESANGIGIDNNGGRVTLSDTPTIESATADLRIYSLYAVADNAPVDATQYTGAALTVQEREFPDAHQGGYIGCAIKVSDTSKDKFQLTNGGSFTYQYDEASSALRLYNQNAHPICGASCGHDDDSHSAPVWQQWPSSSGGILDSGSYYLASTVSLSQTITVTGDVHLCLNGKTIQTNDGGSPFQVQDGGSHTICDCQTTGQLTGGITATGGKVGIYGGAIYGGTYAVDVGGNATLTLSGSPTLTGSAAGIYLQGDAKIDPDGLDKSVSISVGMAAPDVFTTGGGADYIDNFTSANPGYDVIATANGELMLSSGFIVQFELNGGSGSVSDQIVPNGGHAAMPDPAPTKTGYTLDGWYTEQTSGERWDFENNVVTENLTLYARWTANSYIVAFEENANDAVGTMDNQTFTYDQSQKLTKNTFIRPGYTFAGWNTASDGSSAPYADEAEVQNLSATKGDIITLYAQWTPNNNTVYTVKHWQQNLNDTDYTLADTEPLTGTTGASVTPAVKSYEGFTAPSTKTVTIAANGSTVVDYYYTRNSYTVTLTPGKGIASVTGGGEYPYGASVVIHATVSDGYAFSQWSDGNTEQSRTFTMGAEHTTLTAQAAVIPYTITYELNGGDVSGNPIRYHVETDSFTLKNPTRTGYTFAGWTGTGLSEASTSVTIAVGSTGHRTYTATWTPNTYTITYEGMDGAQHGETPPVTHTYDMDTPVPNPTRTGYTFAGWLVNGTGSAVKNLTLSGSGYTDHITLTAQWALEGFTVTITGAPESSVTYGTEITLTATANHAAGDAVDLTYAWYRDDSSTPMEGENSPALTLTDVAHSGDYRVVVTATDAGGQQSTAEAALSVSITPAPVELPEPSSIQFTYNGQTQTYPIPDSELYQVSGNRQTDAGAHTVTVSLNDPDNSIWSNGTTEDQDYTFTIGKKTITATWSGLTQVYGTEESVTATLSGIVDGDDVTAHVTVAVEDAGKYLLTATLTGADTANYTLKNHEATLTIQQKPVVITVTNNVTTTDNVTSPTISAPGLDGGDYEVLYKDADGNVVSDPTEPGSYEVWVKFPDDSNYRHPDGSLEAPVGSFTIAETLPTLYTVTFAGGEDATGDMDPLNAVGGTILTLPECDFDKADARFTGWLYDGKTYQPGDRFTMPGQAVTFTAQWQAVFAVSGTIMEKTDGKDAPAANATVSLWLGANKISEAATTENGTYKFENLLPGIYNLVVTKDVRTVTSKVELTTTDETCDATLPKGATNSIVQVTEGSPDIVVGNLDTVFQQETDDTVYTKDDQDTVKDGGKVEITFTADEKQQGDADDTDADMAQILEKKDDAVTVGLVMDYKLEKTVTPVNGTSGEPTPITQSNVLLEILLPLPAQLQGKASYAIYRVHSSQVQELKEGETNKNGDGEYFTVSDNKTVLILHVKNFSTYAIGYTESSENNNNNNNQTGSGGGSSSPTYAPTVVQPEHGAVTVSPKSPQKGSTVTITATPEDGYTVDTVTVTDAKGQPVTVTPNGDGTYTFVQPTGKVTITVTFRQISEAADCPRDESCPMAAFTDADRSAWYHDGVHYCVEHGLMVGTSQTTFAPNIPITRGMIVTILWRLEGSPMVDAPLDYSDVQPEAWYGEAVRWADSAGVVTGYGNGKFGPNDPITREQMAAMLWRYAGSPAAEGALSAFVDGTQTSGWAQSAMIWAVEQGLIAGVGNGRLEPRGQATRAQAATILMRFAQDMAQ